MKIRWICVALLLPSASLSWADSAFQIQGFALPTGYIGFENPSINESGQVAVTAYNSHLDPTWLQFEGTPFLYSQGQLTALPIADNVWANTTSINSAGNVVGYAADSSGNFHPVLWSNGIMTYLPQGGMPSGEALAINDSNQIAGATFIPPINAASGPTNVQAAVWTGETLNNLGNFGTDSAYAIAINNRSDILINTSNSSLLYQNGMITPITVPTTSYPAINAVNNNDQIPTSDLDQKTNYLWQSGNVIPLGVLPNTVDVALLSINDSGTVVGISFIGPNYTEIATLWKDGIPYDLNSLIDPSSGWTLGSATGITDDGTIAGIGGDGTTQGIFILTPTPDGGFAVSSVPEPATLALLTLSTLPLLLLRRRKAAS